LSEHGNGTAVATQAAEGEYRQKCREAAADPANAGLSTRELARRTGLAWHSLAAARKEIEYERGIAEIVQLPGRPPTTTVEIARLRRDLGTQFRPETPADKAEEYKEGMERGDLFPPIEATETEAGELILTDGFIRVAASELLGRTEIEAVVLPGDERDAVWRALAANARHGLNRDPKTIRNVVRRTLEDPEWSMRPVNEIARHLGVAWSTVRTEQQRMEEEKIRERAAVVHEIGDDSIVPDREPGADDEPEREEQPRTTPEREEEQRENAPPLAREARVPAEEPPPKKEKKLSPAQREKAEAMEKVRAFPLWATLPESKRPLFEADALHYILLLPARDELSLLHRIHRLKTGPGEPEPIYARIVQRFLMSRSYHPREWKLCLGSGGSGCDGTLKCSCSGRGYIN
jgi:ParB-like chromosome segregation protein Spo0J